jgi:hypothetical protein
MFACITKRAYNLRKGLAHALPVHTSGKKQGEDWSTQNL